jgi:hypothetical protein
LLDIQRQAIFFLRPFMSPLGCNEGTAALLVTAASIANG